ncbi:MAG TPA: phosphoribosyltransferase, partial [Steroidobacteraceae bacterium]|nr:phosphoribosyltransferase [Steroidobacteraceae bacterium]
IFADRQDAGRQLAARLRHLETEPQTLVLALPRGGVPVAAEIAKSLHLPLDVLVVRKLGAPGQPELAMGAIASGGAVVMNPEVRAYFSDQEELIDAITKREQQELQRREQLYRGKRPPLSAKDCTTIVVDDGAATGATMRAAVQALRVLQAKQIIVALPVCSVEAEQVLRKEADVVVCLETPRAFYAVGQWYDDFGQTSDDEVRRLLDENAKP